MEATSSPGFEGKTDYILRLPKPHSCIVLTCPRLEDADEISPILNNDEVYPWMGAGLPHPHELTHALHWLESVKVRCDIGQQGLQAPSIASPEEILVSPQIGLLIQECPVRILREVTKGRDIYLGDCGLQRWGFEDVVDKQKRERYREENKAKRTGDPTIVWTIGCTTLMLPKEIVTLPEYADYLKPSHHGKGIMKAAIGTLVGWVAANMNVRHIRTTAMEGNEPSLRALERNGFVVEKTLPEFAMKAGIKVGLHILDWKSAAVI